MIDENKCKGEKIDVDNMKKRVKFLVEVLEQYKYKLKEEEDEEKESSEPIESEIDAESSMSDSREMRKLLGRDQDEFNELV